jgi:hypothetical protein
MDSQQQSVAEYAPETQLLIACAHAHPGQNDLEAIRAACHAVSNWDLLITSATRHGMLALVQQGLHLAGCKLPDPVIQALAAATHQQTLYQLRLAAELQSLSAVFTTHAIPWLVLKGPAVAILAYHSLALRAFTDLDLLVQRSDLERAQAILSAAGYRQAEHVAQAQQSAYMASQHHYTFIRADIVIELHFELRERWFAYPIAACSLWQHAITLQVGSQAIRALCARDQLITLCMHGTGHCWDRLIWICDIAEMLRLQPDLDWPELLAQMRSVGAERMLLLGVQLAYQLIAAPVPAEVLLRIAADQALPQLAGQVISRLFSEEAPPRGMSTTTRFVLAARERWRDRLRAAIGIVCTPTLGDWNAVRLPHVLNGLYYPLRLLRLPVVYGVRLIRSVGGREAAEPPNGYPSM